METADSLFQSIKNKTTELFGALMTGKILIY